MPESQNVRWRRYAGAMDAITGGTCPDDLICAAMSVADAELEEERATTSVGTSASPANATPLFVDTPDQSAAVYELIAHLKEIPVQCTALTGPVWYGSGWRDAITQAEDFAQDHEGEGTPSPDPLATTELSRLLYEADNWWRKKELPDWNDLPHKARITYWSLAHRLLGDLFISRRTKITEEN